MGFLFDHIKNVPGWKTRRKLVAIAVDDFGNVRVDSPQALDKIEKAGFGPRRIFDRLDALETREDLEALFSVLMSVKDSQGNHAVFTPFAISRNLDFDKIKDSGYTQLFTQSLSETFKRLESRWPKDYTGAHEMIQLGIKEKIFIPEFHGREHFNSAIISRLLVENPGMMRVLIDNYSLCCIQSDAHDEINYTATYSYKNISETENFPEAIEDGLKCFEEEYGYKSLVITPPAQKFPEKYISTLSSRGIMAIDRPFIQKCPQENGSEKYRITTSGYDNKSKLVKLVRNVVFEPSDRDVLDSVELAMKQIKTAFFGNRPALISSHRINYCGKMDLSNRERSLEKLSRLLKQVVKTWPDVEFVSVRDLANIIKASK